ncbi:MAG: polysaccharide biosynthesis protein [Prevotella sp.]|nr:polysaccharide biosynthesis protein [Prevotella sp.]
MASLKGLAKDTAIYGLSSIAGKSINYLLVPIHTYAFASASGQYSIVTRLYAATAILILLLTFGMETTMFRFLNKEGEDREKTYSTIITFVGTLALTFAVLVVMFRQSVADFLGYPDTPLYVMAIFLAVAFDAFQSIPLAFLRQQKRPLKFMMVYVGKIAFIVLLNFIYFIALPKLHLNPPGLYGEGFLPDIGYVFYINLAGSIASTFFLWREISAARLSIDKPTFFRLLSYSWPLVLLGVAGQINKSADKLLYPWLDTTPDSAVNLSIYGGVVKVAAIMTMITQAFRYAYEPIVFGKSRDKDSKEYLALSMKFYLIFMLLAFLSVIAFMDILRYIVAPDYWEGLYIVPITMATEIIFGVYFNLSMWYKLIDQTRWGAWFSLTACVIYLAINVIFVPMFGYVACACAGLVAYSVAMLLSYFVGQRKNPVDYPLRDMGFYVGLTLVLFAGMALSNRYLPVWAALSANVVMLGAFVSCLLRRDIPLASLPVVGRKFRK